MIRCHLARLLGERKLKITDVARDTGVNRGTLTRMYYETAERHDIAVLDVLCHYLDCALSDLLEYVEDERDSGPKRLGPRRSA
jgi:putative transcriptional regulator